MLSEAHPQYEPFRQQSSKSACARTHRLLHRLGGAEPVTHHGARSLPTQVLLDVVHPGPAVERADGVGESGEPSQKPIQCVQSLQKPPEWWLALAGWGQEQSCCFRCNTTRWAR